MSPTRDLREPSIYLEPPLYNYGDSAGSDDAAPAGCDEKTAQNTKYIKHKKLSKDKDKDKDFAKALQLVVSNSVSALFNCIVYTITCPTRLAGDLLDVGARGLVHLVAVDVEAERREGPDAE